MAERTPAISFEVCAEDLERIENWLHETVFPPLLEKQRLENDPAIGIVTDKRGREWPYCGAIGGSLTYNFTPTSLGTVLKVRHASGAELDMTDYGSW